ncbi:MAG: efflux RND transporter periplasmic adaptor subunit [Spirochaetales bacterium]|nr:efflux RND transporter periplasmic adaptor subunit [Spirochaetales bacterium]
MFNSYLPPAGGAGTRVKAVFLFFIAAVCAVFAAGCSSGTRETDHIGGGAAKTAEAVPVDVVRADTGSFSITGEYYAKVEPSVMAVLAVPAGGRVEELSAREGDRVSAGMSLGRIDAGRMEGKARLAEQSELIARDTYLRQKELYEKGSVSKLAMDQSKLQWLSATSALSDAQKLLDGALCVSPIDGIVLSRYVELFDDLAPGMASFSVGDIDRLIARIGIPESEIASVREGTEVQVRFPSYPGLVETGMLTRISRRTNDRSVNFEGVVEFSNTTGAVLPGITSLVTLQRHTLDGVITLPIEGVLNTPEGAVVMVERDLTAVSVPVTLGPGDGKRVVIAEGIKEGDRVILGGNHIVTAGRPVVIELK